MEQDWEFFYGVFSELFLWNVFFFLWVAQRADVAELILETIFYGLKRSFVLTHHLTSLRWNEVLIPSTRRFGQRWDHVPNIFSLTCQQSHPFVICIFMNFTSVPAAAKTNLIRLKEQEALFCFFLKEKWYESVNYPQEVLH